MNNYNSGSRNTVQQQFIHLKCICVAYGTWSSGKYQISLINKQEAVCTWVASDFIDRTIKTQSLYVLASYSFVQKSCYLQMCQKLFLLTNLEQEFCNIYDYLQISIFNVTQLQQKNKAKSFSITIQYSCIYIYWNQQN